MSFLSGFEKQAKLKSDAKLQPHQERVRDRIRQGQSLLLYHGLGSGKSLSSIAATEEPGKKIDVVVPAALRTNYKKELNKFTEGESPERNIHSYEGATRNKTLGGGDVLVADEIQRINNSASGRSQTIMKAAPKYKQRILLSGTPIRNAPHELAPVIRTLNPESKIPTSTKDFDARFLEEKKIEPSWWNKTIHGVQPGYETVAKNLPEIREAVHGRIDYHMPKKEGYPSMSEQMVKVPMSEDQQRVYATVTEKADPFIAWKVRHDMPLSKQESQGLNAFMTAARVVSNTTTPYGGKGHSPKFQHAAADMDKHLKENPRGKALVYSNYLDGGVKEYSKHLTAKGISHHIFSGELGDKERKRVVDEYNNDKVKALLISGAGSEGLDLKGTRLVQILEPHWNKQRIDQATGRAARYKSHEHLPENERNVHVMHYHSTHAPTFMNKVFKTKPETSADEYLYNLSQKKDKLNQSFLDVLKAEGEDANSKWEKEHMKTAFEQGFEKNAKLRLGMFTPGRIATHIIAPGAVGAAGGALAGGEDHRISGAIAGGLAGAGIGAGVLGIKNKGAYKDLLSKAREAHMDSGVRHEAQSTYNQAGRWEKDAKKKYESAVNHLSTFDDFNERMHPNQAVKDRAFDIKMRRFEMSKPQGDHFNLKGEKVNPRPGGDYYSKENLHEIYQGRSTDEHEQLVKGWEKRKSEYNTARANRDNARNGYNTAANNSESLQKVLNKKTHEANKSKDSYLKAKGSINGRKNT